MFDLETTELPDRTIDIFLFVQASFLCYETLAKTITKCTGNIAETECFSNKKSCFICFGNKKAKKFASIPIWD
jgi:hypothetical protein